MTEDLAPSQRPTARGLLFRRRSRISPGPLRPVQRRAGGGVAAGMLTGALLGLAFLAAFTLPFVRVGGSPGESEARARGAVRASAVGDASEPGGGRSTSERTVAAEMLDAPGRGGTN
ncbi:hypothetical protein [Methylobacterium radiodurans]|uniref:Uncharacterized protein n=1 Tax=Methylobacterium radiodurans TaxID=2202828 RepID=A0A2U8VT94_9HYPH|nr:hypothetical protein [Methylobacterium radiodurans]AWN37019.1 hypothetical protein DK427_15830 [Methylobacterium radiodurans]